MSIVRFSLLFCLLACGCNGFSAHYKDRTGGENITNNSDFIPLKEGEEPLAYRGTFEDINVDVQKMYENGYLPIGSSDFVATSGSYKHAISQAKKVRASAVIFYSKFSHAETGVLIRTIPKTSRTHHSGSVTAHSSYGGTAYGNYSGHSTTYSSETVRTPYSTNKYQFGATYWVKLSEERIGMGLLLNALSDDMKKAIGSNKGVWIQYIVTGSPAFEADFLAGDILLKIGSESVYDQNSVRNAKNRYRRSVVPLLVFRNGRRMTIELEVI